MSARHADHAEWASRKAAIAAHLPTLYAAIGAQQDAFAHAWNTATESTRRVFLVIAKRAEFLAGKRWDELSADTRGDLKRRIPDLRDWLNRSIPEDRRAS